MRVVARSLLALLLMFGVSGCVLVPFISGFRELGATADSRQELLNKTIKNFQVAIKSSNITAALSFIDKDNKELREAIRDEMRRTKDKEKIVDSRLDFVEYDDDSYHADVEIRTKFFKVPYYVVMERLEKEKWEFFVRKGWQLTSRTSELMKDGEVISDLQKNSVK
ncbi:MAG: hypothetical protein ACOX2O_06265 [Bdellovibrionota bacterium]|jgi:hypothetical protein